jgi:hypothetical protein
LNRYARRAAEKTAAFADGVVDVINNLTIKPR